jgi:hypothetical protein
MNSHPESIRWRWSRITPTPGLTVSPAVPRSVI